MQGVQWQNCKKVGRQIYFKMKEHCLNQSEKQWNVLVAVGKIGSLNGGDMRGLMLFKGVEVAGTAIKYVENNWYKRIITDWVGTQGW